jgi:copper chaperone
VQDNVPVIQLGLARLFILSRKSMTFQLTVPNMSCSVCASTITKALQAVDANASIQADPITKLVSVETQASETAIKEALAAAGYPVG